jgi:hypothetical protein
MTEPKNIRSLMSIEGELVELCTIIHSAAFMFDEMVRNKAFNKDGRVAIEMDNDDFSSLSLMMATLEEKKKAFEQFYYDELKGKTEGNSHE